MSTFSKLKAALTPKNGGALTAFLLAAVLELLMKVGKVGVFLLIVFGMLSLVVLGVYLGHKTSVFFGI